MSTPMYALLTTVGDRKVVAVLHSGHETAGTVVALTTDTVTIRTKNQVDVTILISALAAVSMWAPDRFVKPIHTMAEVSRPYRFPDVELPNEAEVSKIIAKNINKGTLYV